jgi:hypothetical protein
MSRPRGRGGLRHISDILRDITDAEREPEPPRIQPHAFNRHCPCGDCMRVYLRSLEKPRGDAA